MPTQFSGVSAFISKISIPLHHHPGKGSWQLELGYYSQLAQDLTAKLGDFLGAITKRVSDSNPTIRSVSFSVQA